MLLKWVNRFGFDLEGTLKRFPIPILCSIAFTWVSLYNGLDSHFKTQLLNILFASFFVSISLRLYKENVEQSTGLYIFSLVTLMGLIPLEFLNNTTYKTEIVFLNIACFLSLTIAPFGRSKENNQQIWAFNYRLWIHVLLSTFAGLIVFLGFTLIITTFSYLFEIKFYPNIYIDGWIVVASFFSPMLALAGIPKSFNDVESQLNKPFTYIIKFIGIPFLLIYALILHAYCIKILVDGTLPHGIIAYLVSVFSGLSIFVYAAGYPLWQTSSRLCTVFGRYYVTLMIIPLGMFTLSLYERLSEYGVTEFRYGLVVYLIWLVISVITILTPIKRKLFTIFSSLILLLVVAGAGPFDSKTVSEVSQVNRLSAILKRNSLLSDGKYKKTKAKISRKDLNEISSIVDYLVKIRRVDALRSWLADNPQAYINKTEAIHLESEKLVLSLDLPYIPYYERRNRTEENQSDKVREKLEPFRIEGEHASTLAFEITGYDFYMPKGPSITEHNRRSVREIRLPVKGKNLAFDVKLDGIEKSLTIINVASNKKINFDLSAIVSREDLIQSKPVAFVKKKMVFTNQNEEVEVKLILDELEGEFNKNKLSLTKVKTSLFFKIK